MILTGQKKDVNKTLYNNGVEYVDWVNGYTVTIAGPVTRTRNVDNLEIEATDTLTYQESGGRWSTDNLINVTNFNEIIVTCTYSSSQLAGSYFEIVLSDSKLDASFVARNLIQDAKNNDKVILDVSSIAGSYYVQFGVRWGTTWTGTCNMKVYKVEIAK